MLNKKTDRRSFLKALGVGAAAATVTVPSLPKLKRQPKEGERLKIWGPEEVKCLSCEREVSVKPTFEAVYSGHSDEEGFLFLVDDEIRCPNCQNRMTRFVADDVKFIEMQERKTDE